MLQTLRPYGTLRRDHNQKKNEFCVTSINKCITDGMRTAVDIDEIINRITDGDDKNYPSDWRYGEKDDAVASEPSELHSENINYLSGNVKYRMNDFEMSAND